MLYSSGSIFKFKEKKEIYGELLGNVSSNKDYKHCGCMIPFFIKLSNVE